MDRFKGQKIGVYDKRRKEITCGDVIEIQESDFDAERGVVRYSDKLVTFIVEFTDGNKIERVPIADISEMIVVVGSTINELEGVTT